AVPWRVDKRVEVLLRLEPLECEVDGDTPLPLVLQLVQNPSVLEAITGPGLLGLLRELVYGPLIHGSEVKEKVTHAGALPVVYVTCYDKVQVRFVCHLKLPLTHRQLPRSLFKVSWENSDFVSFMGVALRVFDRGWYVLSSSEQATCSRLRFPRLPRLPESVHLVRSAV